MEPNIEVREEGVSVIFVDGTVAGIIYNDQKTKAKRLFNLVEMSVGEIAELLTGELYTGKLRNVVDETKDK